MKYKKVFVSISAILIIASAVLFATLGLKPSIDFTGGAQMELLYSGTRPEQEALITATKNVGFGDVLVVPSGEQEYLLKTRDLTEAERSALLSVASINGQYPVTQKSYNSIGPSIGSELKKKAITAMILVSLAIVLFIAYAFRKVSDVVSSWKYGVIAIITLLHDVIAATGFYVVLSHFNGAEADTLFVVALLTILGLSVSDTIVVFDRIRENLKLNAQTRAKEDFETTVGKSLQQTIVRSINTSFTVILALLALAIFGPESTRNFAIVLTVGMFFGSYSSIFMASPFLVLWEKATRK